MKMTISIGTRERIDFVDITRRIQEVVDRSGVRSGIALIFIPHTTAGVTINEKSDPDVLLDLKKALYDIVPKTGFRHFEGNSDSHTESLLTGQELSLIIDNGELVLGTWQSIYFAEYDGPRNRKIHIKILKG